MSLLREGHEESTNPYESPFDWTSIDAESRKTIREKLNAFGIDMTPVEALVYSRPDGTFDERGDYIETVCEETLKDPTIPRFVNNRYFADEKGDTQIFDAQPLLFVNFDLPVGIGSRTRSAIILCRFNKAPFDIYVRARNTFLDKVNQRFVKAGLKQFPPHK